MSQGVGVALSVLTRCDNETLRKVCRRSVQREYLSEKGRFTERRKKKGVAHAALLSLWDSFRSASDQSEEALVSIVTPLIQEWTSSKDSIRRSLFILLASSFCDVDKTKFSKALGAALSSESQSMQYACMLVLQNVVKEAAQNRSKTVEEKAHLLEDLSNLLPKLLAICRSNPGEDSNQQQACIPTKLTSLASDSLLLIVIEMLNVDRAHPYSAQDFESCRENFLSSARWLWKQLPLLLEFLARHEEWTKGLSAMEGVINDAEIMLQALRAMNKRILKMVSFSFAEEDKDDAKIIHACCWMEWAPLLLFDLKAYCKIEEAKCKDSHANSLKKTTSALKYAGNASSSQNLLSIQEALFRQLVSAGFVIGLGRYRLISSEAGHEYLTSILEAVSDITSSTFLSTPSSVLAANIATFVAAQLEQTCQQDGSSSGIAREFFSSVLRSCKGNSNISKTFLRSLLTNRCCAALLVKQLIELFPMEDKEETETALMALKTMLGMDELSSQKEFRDALVTICELVVNLDDTDFRNEIEEVLTKLPISHVMRLLFSKARREEKRFRSTAKMLLRFLRNVSTNEYDLVKSTFREFIKSCSKGHPKRILMLVREWNKDEESQFWNLILDVILQASGADPSNQLLIQTLSALSTQLNHCKILVGRFVLSTLQDQERKREGEAELGVFTRLHPFLVLRIISNASFDSIVSENLHTRVSSNDTLEVADDILGYLVRAMKSLSEDMQVRKLCSELCGKMNPKYSFSVMLVLLKSGVASGSHHLSRACLYAYCCSFQIHKDNEIMFLNVKCNDLSKELLNLHNILSSQNDKPGSNEIKKTQLGCLDCFGAVLILKLEYTGVDDTFFTFDEVMAVLFSQGMAENKFSKVLGIKEETLQLDTHSFLANALISICPKLKQTRRADLYSSLLLPGCLKHMMFRSKPDYEDPKCSSFDEILLQVLFISVYHLPSMLLSEFAPDVLHMVISIMSKDLPSGIQVAAVRTAACILTKDDLILSCKDVLISLEEVMLRAMNEGSCSSDMKSICHAVVSAMGTKIE